MDLVAFRALADVVAELDKREDGLKAAHARWRELRALAATQLSAAEAIARAQARWMAGAGS